MEGKEKDRGGRRKTENVEKEKKEEVRRRGGGGVGGRYEYEQYWQCYVWLAML